MSGRSGAGTAPRITAVRPACAVEGGRITIEGTDLPTNGAGTPEVRLGPHQARVVHASRQVVSVIVPAGLDGGRTRVPVVAEVEALGAWLARAGAGPAFVLSPRAGASLADLAPSPPGETIRLLVGPEGGLSPREVERAGAAGFAGLRLGPRVLRTETAALVALAALQARWGDLR